MIKLNLVSPTREENYTLEDALKKAFIRSGIKADKFEIEHKHTCFYGSKDFYVNVENLHVSDSLWTDSISFRIDGTIPIHTTEAGKLEYGFGCGCWEDYGGQFPDDSEFNPEYIKCELGKITCKLKDEKQVVYLSEIDRYNDEHRVIVRILRDIVQTYIARDVMSNLTCDD